MSVKPKIGEPCNGCGLCCLSQPCKNGAYILGLVKNLGDDTYPGKCPAIIQKHSGEYLCGIILNPNKYIKNSKYPAKIKSKYFAILIGSGIGCDELYPDDNDDEITNLQNIMEKMKNNPQWIGSVQKAMKIIHGI